MKRSEAIGFIDDLKLSKPFEGGERFLDDVHEEAIAVLVSTAKQVEEVVGKLKIKIKSLQDAQDRRYQSHLAGELIGYKTALWMLNEKEE